MAEVDGTQILAEIVVTDTRHILLCKSIFAVDFQKILVLSEQRCGVLKRITKRHDDGRIHVGNLRERVGPLNHRGIEGERYG